MNINENKWIAEHEENPCGLDEKHLDRLRELLLEKAHECWDDICEGRDRWDDLDYFNSQLMELEEKCGI